MRLAELVTLYVTSRNQERPIGRELSPRSCEHLAEAARIYGYHLRREARVGDLNAASVNDFLVTLLANGRSPYTAKNRRSALLVLWRFACRIGLSAVCNGVRCIHCPPLAIAGYTADDMTRLIACARGLPRSLRGTGVAKAIWWESFLRTDWDTGLRIGDMLRVEVRHVDPGGWLWVNEGKTRKCGWVRLRASTLAAITQCVAGRAERQFVWPGYTRRNAGRAFAELARLAGVGGTSRYVRRGGSSECDRLFPGCGWRFLRHSCPQVWETFYRVAKICDDGKPMPPEL